MIRNIIKNNILINNKLKEFATLLVRGVAVEIETITKGTKNGPHKYF